MLDFLVCHNLCSNSSLKPSVQISKMPAPSYSRRKVEPAASPEAASRRGSKTHTNQVEVDDSCPKEDGGRRKDGRRRRTHVKVSLDEHNVDGQVSQDDAKNVIGGLGRDRSTSPSPSKVAEVCEGLQCEVVMLGVHHEGVWTKGDMDWKEKQYQVLGLDNVDAIHEHLAKIGVGVTCRKGMKPDQPNQDNLFYCSMGDFTVFGVADGHGLNGHWASHWTTRFIVGLVLREISSTGSLPSDERITKLFATAHDSLMKTASKDRFDLTMSGSTLSVCILDRSSQVALVAWVGDSRCVVGNGKKSMVPHVTVDHKPDLPEETRRIRSCGGEVLKNEWDIPHRVYVRGTDKPGLAMSRAIGDLYAHTAGVIHTPGIQRFQFQSDSVMLCCSDGVWEFLDETEAVSIIHGAGRDHVRQATQELARQSRDRWIREDLNCTDDITVVAVWL